MNNRIWTALTTPMHPNGEVDHQTLAERLKAQDEAGNGILLLGSTGEGLNLAPEERAAIVANALEQGLNVPLMVGLPGIEQSATLRWLEHLEGLKVQAYLAPVPLYAKPGPRGQYNWFKKLLDASSRSVMIYNIPGRTGAALSPWAMEKLAKHPNLWAVKESGGSLENLAAYRAAAPFVRLFCGDDGLFPEFAALRAEGLVSVAANLWPKATQEYVLKAINKKLFAKEKTLWRQSAQQLLAAGNPVTVKRLQHLIGQLPHPTCRPPLSAEEDIDEAALMETHRAIDSWFTP